MTTPNDPHLLVTLHERLWGNWDEDKIIIEKPHDNPYSTDEYYHNAPAVDR